MGAGTPLAVTGLNFRRPEGEKIPQHVPNLLVAEAALESAHGGIGGQRAVPNGFEQVVRRVMRKRRDPDESS